jgi:hypothetical protein
MSKTRRTLQLIATPVVVVGIYVWLIREAYRDLRIMLKKQGGAK